MNIWNQVVFVAWYHDGPNRGKKCSALIAEITKEVLTSYPSMLSYGQMISDQVLRKALDKACTKPGAKHSETPEKLMVNQEEDDKGTEETAESEDEQSQENT